MIDESEKKLITALDNLARLWLNPKRKTKYMFNKYDPSICDLACFGELTSIVGTGFDLEKRWPSIHKWYFKSMCGIPEFKEVHNKGIEKVKKLISVRKSKGLPTYEEESKVDEGPNTNAGQAKKVSLE